MITKEALPQYTTAELRQLLNNTPSSLTRAEENLIKYELQERLDAIFNSVGEDTTVSNHY